MATGTEEPGRDELLAENRARRAQLRAEEEAKAARKAGEDTGVDEPDLQAGDAVEDSATDEPTGESRDRQPRRLLTVLVAAVAVLAIAVGVLGYLLATAGSDSTIDDQAMNGAVDDAKTYATTVLTYSSGDYADLDKRIRAISTPEFADRYIKSSQQARQGNDEAQAKGTAEAKEAGLISLSDTTAKVLVAVDQKVTSPLVPAVGPDGMNYESRITITLTKDGDTWKLSDLTVV
ncbi:hypothetical protein [Gordonia phthalatica]|uniref:Mce-associated membrane protein n=1 Tax=Gordonia phthalatica TaxID=1136941 RepID=A0A0N7FUT3_9ACTN|nr:hypothetical protein [Gordonia phthalatica]ALG85239.1 hypothetical protein ACH46_13070 [Gordonia phthalatica]